MPAANYNPYIEQGSAWSHGFGTDLDYTGLLGRAFISKCGQVFASPTVTIPSSRGEIIMLALTPAETLAIPTSGTSSQELENYDYLVELYDPNDSTWTFRMEDGIARVSPRRVP
jgi:hypothetical protein